MVLFLRMKLPSRVPINMEGCTEMAGDTEEAACVRWNKRCH